MRSRVTHALELLRRDPAIRFLFTDVAMPEMNGFELAQEARRVRPDLPILLMTGYADFAELDAGTIPLPLQRERSDAKSAAPAGKPG